MAKTRTSEGRSSAGAGDDPLRAAVTRRARAADAATLSELAFSSKSFWGYDPDFLEACRSELTLTPEFIGRAEVHLLELHGRTLGFYSLVRWNSDIELGHFFVDAEHIGNGVGRALWRHAVDRARALGFEHLLVQSDPNAEGFYLRLGAERIGEVPSQVQPGRSLPLLLFPLI